MSATLGAWWMVATRISRGTISDRKWGSIVPYCRPCLYGKLKSAHTVWRLIPDAFERAVADAPQLEHRCTDGSSRQKLPSQFQISAARLFVLEHHNAGGIATRMARYSLLSNATASTSVR
jgi:hypothetical protein